MTRIARAFQNENKKAFVVFLTCGDPDLGTTEQLVYEMADAGVDVIELGIPFSDPMAEGPVIQAANARGCTQGITTDDVMDMVTRIRKTCDIALVYMTYANVVYSYGTERFVARAQEVGIDGLILPDVPLEESEEFCTVCKQYDLDFIPLVAPTSSERVSHIAQSATGFVYCVSSLGVTGVRSEITEDVAALTKLVKDACDTPCAVGFGISSPETAQQMAKISDGAIVGSAVMSIIAKHGKDCIGPVRAYVEEMAQAVHSV